MSHSFIDERLSFEVFDDLVHAGEWLVASN
jgi:hypothetical protein